MSKNRKRRNNRTFVSEGDNERMKEEEFQNYSAAMSRADAAIRRADAAERSLDRTFLKLGLLQGAKAAK